MNKGRKIATKAVHRISPEFPYYFRFRLAPTPSDEIATLTVNRRVAAPCIFAHTVSATLRWTSQFDGHRTVVRHNSTPRDGRGGFMPGAGFLAQRVQVDAAEESETRVHA